MLHGHKLTGEGTFFTKIGPGEKVRVGKAAEAHKLYEIVSDTEAFIQTDELQPVQQPQGEWLSYDLFEHVDQSKMFDSVHIALAKGNNLGIFPEGGSHDNTDLLPLKVGVAVIGQ